MAEDKDQKRLETLKLYVEYLKHLTTLSGAATFIVLAVLEYRRGDAGEGLWIPALYFGLTAIVSVIVMYLLIAGYSTEILDSVFDKIFIVLGVVTGLFVWALFQLTLLSFDLSARTVQLINAVYILVLAGIIAYLLYMFWKTRA